MDTLIKTGSLDMRGREVLDNTPIEIPLANMKRTPSIFERMRAIILQQQKDAEDVIVDEADLAEDLNDFSYENESDLFTENTQYTVPGRAAGAGAHAALHGASGGHQPAACSHAGRQADPGV